MHDNQASVSAPLEVQDNPSPEQGGVHGFEGSPCMLDEAQVVSHAGSPCLLDEAQVVMHAQVQGEVGQPIQRPFVVETVDVVPSIDGNQGAINSDMRTLSTFWGDEEPDSDPPHDNFTPVLSKAQRKKTKSQGLQPAPSHMNLRNRGGPHHLA